MLIMLLLLCGLAASAPQAIQNRDTVVASVARYDRPSVWSSTLKSVTLPVKATRASSMKLTNDTTAKEPLAQPLLVTLACSQPEATCQKVKRAIESVGTRMAKSLRIREVIKVKASYRSLCGENKDCELKETLGQAAASSFFAAQHRTDARFVLYPQALVKQTKTNITLTYSEFDIIAEFNADKNFWFKEDGVPIDPKQTDFEFVAAHEIVHGLGIDTAWSQWKAIYNGQFPSNFVAPMVNFEDADTMQKVLSWQPVNVFDNFIIDNASEKPLNNFLFDIYRAAPTGQKLSDFYNKEILEKGRPFQAGQAVFATITANSGSIKFQSSLGSVKLASSAGNFLSGSSVAHVDASYSETPDFLMIPAAANLVGISLDSIIARNSKNGTVDNYGIFGPGTLGILTAIGYRTVLNDAQLSLNVSPNPAGVVELSSSNRIGISAASILLIIALAMT